MKTPKILVSIGTFLMIVGCFGTIYILINFRNGNIIENIFPLSLISIILFAIGVYLVTRFEGE